MSSLHFGHIQIVLQSDTLYFVLYNNTKPNKM